MKKNEVQIGHVYLAKITDAVVPVRIDREHPAGGWHAVNTKTNRKVRIKSAAKLRSEVRAGKAKAKKADKPVAETPAKTPPAIALAAPQTRQTDVAKITAWAVLKDGEETFTISCSLPVLQSDDVITWRLTRPWGRGSKIVHASTRGPKEIIAAAVKQLDAKEMDATAVETWWSKVAGKTPKAKPTQGGTPRGGTMSAINAAVEVLRDAGKPLNCKEMIEAMSAKGLWTSPGGKTPASTLYSSILREIQNKGKDARFTKAEERGKFALAG